MNFALDKQIERLVEVLAASALLQVNNRDTEAFRKLREHAFPEKIDVEKKYNHLFQEQFETEDNFEKFQGKMKDWNDAGHEVCDDL